MKVVLYLRYSSDRQTEQSIEGQNRVCTAFCEQMNYEIVDRYIDRATTAFKDTDKRTEFQRMIRDSDKQLWEGVIVYKLDRFARNRYDSATYKAKLKKNGVRVISATENISDNPEGVILEAVLEGMAEFYSKELSQKISRGMYESASKCNSLGGPIPLGYKIENKKFVIDENNARIVREAFNMYAEGAAISEICEIFNQKGYKTSKNADFNKNSFRTMFKNKKYIGIYKYKDKETKGGIPAIISDEMFDVVNKRLKENAASPSKGKAKTEYLLSQKIFCGHCNSPMIGECGTSKDGTIHNYYTCSARKKYHSCDKKLIRKEFIEQAVVQDVLTHLTPDVINDLANVAIKEAECQIQKNSLIPSLKKEITEIDRSIANLIRMIEKGISSDSLACRLEELEKEKASLKKRLADEQSVYPVLEKEHIIWWLNQFCKGDITDVNFQKRVINLLVNSVTVWDIPDGNFKITIAYNLSSMNSAPLQCSDLNHNASPAQNPNNFAS